MGDAGIDLLKPGYPKWMFVPEDVAYWEVLYDDGTVLCEAEGARYDQIERTRLVSFRIIYNGTIVFEMFPTNGRSGHHLIYRRRTKLSDHSDRDVVFIVGLAPLGPFYVIDIANEQYFEDNDIITSLTPMKGEAADLLPHWTSPGSASLE